MEQCSRSSSSLHWGRRTTVNGMPALATDLASVLCVIRPHRGRRVTPEVFERAFGLLADLYQEQ